MDLLSEGLLERVQRAGERLSLRLAAVGGRKLRRARGGFAPGAPPLGGPGAQGGGEGRELGLLVNAIGERVVRLAPPLTVTDEEIDRASELLAEAVAKA